MSLALRRPPLIDGVNMYEIQVDVEKHEVVRRVDVNLISMNVINPENRLSNLVSSAEYNQHLV